MKRSSLLVGGLVVLSSSAIAGPKVDDLLCKRNDTTLYNDPAVVLGITAEDYTSVTSPDGARRFKDRDKGGFSIVDVKTGKVKVVHNKDRTYDCDMTTREDGTANSVRWLGNDLVFAQGWFCDEFAVKPYLVNPKTGRFIGYLKVTGMSPEAHYQFARLGGSLWAAAIYDHNQGENAVVVFDAKSGKIKSTKKATAAEIAKLPDCAAK